MTYPKIKKSELVKGQYRPFALGLGTDIGDIVFVRLYDEKGIQEMPFEIVGDDFEGGTFKISKPKFVGPDEWVQEMEGNYES